MISDPKTIAIHTLMWKRFGVEVVREYAPNAMKSP